jgi:diamine N-acetyltransferase
VDSPLVVREANSGDAATIARLNDVVQALHYEAFPDRFNEPGGALVEPAFLRMLKPLGASQPETKAWVCVDQHDEAIGYVLAVLRERPANPFTKAARWIELDQICVLDEARGLGAGRLLATSVVDWARDRGVELLELSVWDFNAGARAFFDSLGFTPLWRRQALRLPVK